MKIAVTAFPRSKQGTSASRRLRNSGKVPGIVYGAGKPVQQVEFDQAAMLRHLKMEAFHASILDLTVDGQTVPALLRDFQMHPFRPMVLHVDMQRVDKNQKVHMKVPLHFVNADICIGVKQGGGAVQHILNDLEVQCLPDDLPEYIEVDVKDLQVAHSMHVNELKLPTGVEPIPRLKKENPGVVMVQVVKEAAAEEADAAPKATEITGQKPEEAAAAGDKKDGGAKKEAAPAKKEGGK
jgi:large subunit ribosomal protein L25